MRAMDRKSVRPHIRALANWRMDHYRPDTLNAMINERAAYVARWAEVAEDGVIAVVRSGMDCDCSQYRHVAHLPVPVSVFAWQRAEDEHYEWLDGPESTWFARPSDEPRGYVSRDRALEAFEDGRSTVLWGDL